MNEITISAIGIIRMEIAEMNEDIGKMNKAREIIKTEVHGDLMTLMNIMKDLGKKKESEFRSLFFIYKSEVRSTNQFSSFVLPGSKAIDLAIYSECM
jgi:hypothetical protein